MSKILPGIKHVTTEVEIKCGNMGDYKCKTWVWCGKLEEGGGHGDKHVI